MEVGPERDAARREGVVIKSSKVVPIASKELDYHRHYNHSFWYPETETYLCYKSSDEVSGLIDSITELQCHDRLLNIPPVSVSLVQEIHCTVY